MWDNSHKYKTEAEMENTVYEINTPVTKRTLVEFSKATRTKSQYTVTTVALALLVVSAILFAAFSNWALFVFFVVLGALLLLFFFVIAPEIGANKTLSQYRSDFGGQVMTEVIMDERSISNNNVQAKVNVSYEYKMLSELIETEHLYILMLKSKHAIIVDKEGFVKGNIDQFPAFVRNKAPGITMPKGKK